MSDYVTEHERECGGDAWVSPCLGCTWTLLWSPYATWQDYGRGHDRRVGLRLVRRLRRGGFPARLVPSEAAESTIGQRAARRRG